MNAIGVAPQSPAHVRRAGKLAVRVEGLVKRFPIRRGWRDLLGRRDREYVLAADDVSLEIPEGEFFGILGPNGAGKTTLFKMLATLITPDSGTGTVDGHDILREPTAVRRVLAPVIGDERSLFWRLSGRENLKLFATLYGVERSAQRERIERVLTEVGLTGAADRSVGTYSSGMKQRLLIGRALLADPRVLLLDEPTRSLDPVSARDFRVFLREELVGRRGCTVLLATHNPDEAIELCGRIGILAGGRMLAVGPADVLWREIGRERHRLWTSRPDHPCLQNLPERGIGCSRATLDEDGWSRIDLEIPGGQDEAAGVLRALVDAGVPVARFERVRPSLPDLIERIVERNGGPPLHG